MDGSLFKQRLRKETNEEVQRAQEETDKRSSRINDFSKTQIYKDIVAYLSKIEVDAYYNIRHPEQRKNTRATQLSNGETEYRDQMISLEHFIGKQDGRLEVIEDFRFFIMQGLAHHRRKLDNERRKLQEKKEKNGR